MKDWEELDDMIINEKEKTAIQWCVYGNDDEYFLSQIYQYDDDYYDYDGDKDILINEKITPENTLEDLIERTKNMR